MASSAEVYHQAWHGRVDCERQARYYAVMAHRYETRNRQLNIGAFATSVLFGALGIVFLQFRIGEGWLAVVFGNVVLIVGASPYLLDWSSKATQAAVARRYYRHLAQAWTQLWWTQHDADATARARVLTAQQMNAPDVEIGEDRALNDHCHEVANRIVKAEYQAGAAA